jgi:hypothetical protein
MSCWVVPSVAAELWGCSVEQVMNAIQGGDVPTKEDSGWTFIDVAPDSPKLETPRSVLPPTYSVVSQAETMALTEPFEQSEESESSTDWKRQRETVAASRRAPLAKAA